MTPEFGDDITTDHISPAGQAAAAGEAGRWLVENGEDPRDLNVYASRRGNWEVMLRGLFTNRTVVNHLDPGLPAGSTIHVPSGEAMRLWRAAERYRAGNQPVVVVAGERYGAGSSRDWAAKGLGLLGVRAVIAASFERFHRSNLIDMGIPPLVFEEPAIGKSLALEPGDLIGIAIPQADLRPRLATRVAVHRRDGRVEEVPVRLAVETELECGTIRAGGMLPLILKRFIPG